MAQRELTKLLLENPAGIMDEYEQYPITPVGETNAPRDELDAAQLEALQYRFATLRDKIPMLKKLADGQNITEINELNDVVPLLFEHTMYKSYPPSLLEKGNFTQITRWMNKLTAHDLSDIDVSDCDSIDSWLDVLDEKSPVLLSHSSGTSGSMSFIPIGKSERLKSRELRKRAFIKSSGTEELPELYIVHPWYRSGRSGQLRSLGSMVEGLLKSDDYFRTAYPIPFSSDVQYLAAKLQAAQSKGTLDRVKITPYQQQKKDEFDALQKNLDQHLGKFFTEIADELRGKRVYMAAVWNILHNMAKAGLSRGLEGVFAPDSIIITGGGAKGMVPPEGWEDDVKKFIGVDRLRRMYAMSEIQGAHWMCEEGHYHLASTVIPFLLDPKTSKPLPRVGTVTGRAAFFDLGCDARWGGFITGDEITIDWDKQCPCGRPGRFVHSNVRRFSEKEGGDDKITCAATEDSHRQAMSFLNEV